MPSKILIISLDNVGDLVFASALVAPLKSKFPRASIGIWCKQYTADIAALIGHVNIIFTSDPFWDTAPGHAKGSLSAFSSTLAQVGKAGYDIAIITSLSWKAAAAARVAGIAQRVGFSGRGARLWLTDPVGPQNKTRPILKELRRLLEPLGVIVGALSCRLERDTLESKRQALRTRLGTGQFLAVHPFAGDLRRCVSAAEWGRFSTLCKDSNLLWIGTSAELIGLRRVIGRKSNWFFMDEIGDGSLSATAAAISMAERFIGHDSGPLHVANALGVACVGIYAPGEPARTSLQGVGPFQILSRSTPAEVTSQDILDALEKLPG